MEGELSGVKASPLKSLFADDEIIADILPAFVQNMPRYVSTLRDSVERRDWVASAKICHDLKGTAGGYGYPQIGQVAQKLEEEIKGARQVPVIESYLADAITLCHRAVLGLGR